MELTENEYIALKYLNALKSNPDTKFDKPENLTKAQFTSALRSLTTKSLVRTAFIEGGECYDARIRIEGEAALDDLARDEKRALKNIIKGYNIDWDQYCLLKHAKETGKADNIFGITYNEYHKIYGPCATYGYLRRVGGVNLQLTRNGENLLADIEDELNQQIGESDSKILREEDKPEQSKPKSEPSGIFIPKKRCSDFIKTIWALWSDGVFVDSSGAQANLDTIMENIGSVLNEPNLRTKYSSSKNKALKSKKATFLRIAYKIQERLEEHYDTRDERKINK